MQEPTRGGQDAGEPKQGTPAPADPEAGPPPPAPDGPPPPAPTGPTFAQRWGNLILTAAIVVIAVGVVVWVVRRGNPVALTIDGQPIANAEAVIDEATAAFRQITADDGAHPPDGAGCWFAPPADSATGADRPRIACGPVRLGVTTGDKFWIVGSVSYSPSAVTTDEWTARFGGLRGIEALDAGDLVRPDATDPPDAANLAAPDAVLRDREGRHLLGVPALLADIERSLKPAADRARASLATDAACWFGTTDAGEGRLLSDGALWCGPVLLPTSSPDEPWARVNVFTQQADVFDAAHARATPPATISGTQKLPPGTRLHRPDGRPPPEHVDLAPPDAKAQNPGFIDVLTEIPPDLRLTAPTGDARLNIPARRLTLDGLARVPKVGAGRSATVAAPGEELVVARYRREDAAGLPGTRATAQIVSGARQTPFADWSGLPPTGLIVVSAPRGTDPVLEVLFDGVSQTISLVTGRRIADPRPALYRASTDVGINRPLDLSVPLPAGPPAGATAVVTSVRLEAWRERLGWPPPGRAFVTVSLQDLALTRPCCALTRVEVVPRWTLALPDGTVIEPGPPTAGSANRTVTFAVPETMTTATLQVSIDVTWNQRGAPGAVTAGPVTFPLDLPP